MPRSGGPDNVPCREEEKKTIHRIACRWHEMCNKTPVRVFFHPANRAGIRGRLLNL